MDIASSPDRPITLVFGKNGGGKTSLLTAIYWCLYGKMDLEEDKGIQNLVNDHAIQEKGVSKSNPARATVTLYASHTTHGQPFLYQIERGQRAYETNRARTEAPDGLTVTRATPPEGYQYGDDVVSACRQNGEDSATFQDYEAQRVIGQILAEGVAKYFFYPGETLSFPFKDDRKSKRLLQEFLREISARSKFAPFAETIAEAHKNLKQQSKAHAEADSATQRLQADIEQLTHKLAMKEQRLPDARTERETAEENKNHVDAQLALHEEYRGVLAEERAAKALVDSSTSDVEHAEQALSDALASAYLCVASPLFDAVIEVFSQKPYPSDISSTLVEQMRETMKCICGRELTDEILKSLEPLSPTDESVSKRMITLNSYATSLRTSSTERTAVDTAHVALKKSNEARSDAIRTLSSAQAKVADQGADHFGSVDKDDLVAARSRFQEDMRILDMEIGGLQISIDEAKQDIASKEADKQAAAPKTDKAVHRAAAIAQEIDELLDDIERKQADVARGHLEDLIEENYVIYKRSLRAKIDPEFRVKIHETIADRLTVKSVGDIAGSETALLTYAFAAAAARLIPQYQTLTDLLTTIPVFEEVEHIPLVVDAPFTNLGQEYKRRVMELMTKGFSQVVVLTESSDTEVLEDTADRIGAEYIVRFEGDLKDDVDTTFTWKNRTLTYASSNREVSRSTLEPIEV